MNPAFHLPPGPYTRRITIHYCDPTTMDHPLHRLVGMHSTGWWVIALRGCVGTVYGPFVTHEAAEAYRAGSGLS